MFGAPLVGASERKRYMYLSTEEVMESISQFSLEELQDEIKRRDENKSNKPEPLKEKDFSALIQTCTEYIEEIATKEYADEDFTEWIYEAALEAVYGEKIWDWKNAR